MAEDLEEIVYCFDWDKTIFEPPSRWPILVDMSYAWINEIKETNPKKYNSLRKRGAVLKMLMIGAKIGSKFMGKAPDHSGETVSLRMYDGLFLEDAGISEEFVNDYASKLAESGRLNTFFTAYASKPESERKKLAIITSEPTQLITKVLEYLGITEVPVYGNDFRIKNGVIVGFESSLGGKSKKDDGVLHALEESGASVAYLLDDNPAVVLNIKHARAFSLSENKLKIDGLLTKLRFKNDITYVDTVKEFLINDYNV
jgi:hypothetical protein